MNEQTKQDKVNNKFLRKGYQIFVSFGKDEAQKNQETLQQSWS